ncbi:haloacid dehalogenase-like hydrolase domain-containing protein 2 [Pholiota molesta]|nr:haloacid dehalogenase-like hydrolase domain-containing protein 2 [Pholiota molesta]
MASVTVFSTILVSKITQQQANGDTSSITALLIDLSGTLHIGPTPTRNAVDAYHRLCKSSIPFRLCSNTSQESTASLVKRLDKMGFGISDSDPKTGTDTKDKATSIIWTSLGAVAKVIKDMGLKEPLLLLSDSARQENLKKASALPSAYDSVVVGHAPLNTAFRILKGEMTAPMDISTPVAAVNHAAKIGANQSKPIPLIATHKAKYPTKAFFQTVIQDFTKEELSMSHGPKINARGRIAVIGDDVEADLGEGALELGYGAYLVMFDSYADFIDSLLSDAN